ncbi:penicillin acylase family protein [Streptomyces sp. TRM68367]|uniref:penicillin acylase family protein n=1 Tax=Streptomyces sp. TRM68367 TaxID=2758415 RepID=UPI00165CC9A9|nr:penicillin acylase family protein [Streptomyces sp. TRM68367]MBC9730662.1 penicillin acylase family protein [Streptomyces sp. TRM68367]
MAFPRAPLPARLTTVVVGLLALALAALPTTAPAAVDQGPRDTGVVIRYTEYGIPHIEASDYRGLGFGYGYAAARDNICALAETYMTVRGDRSRHLGPEAAPDSGLSAASSNLNSDLYFRGIEASGVVRRLARSAPPLGPEPEVMSMVRGYVAGYNRQLRETGADGIGDPACRGAAWVRPITELDVYRHVHAIATISGSGSAVDGIVEAQPPGTSAAARDTVGAPSAARMVRALRARNDQGLGSNAIGVGARGATRSGSVLLGNPHYPWQGARRFWQSQLTIPGRLNVTGASLLGLPVVAIGHNEKVAWSHTVSTAATFGLHEVRTVPGDPTSYLVDGRPERMHATEVSVPVREADGITATVRRTLWSTRYGPVVTAGPGVPLPWGASAYSLGDPNAQNLRLLNSWLGLDRAKDTDDVRATLARTQGLPWVNTVATDRRGRALYADLQVVPHVTDEHAQRCSTALGRQVFPVSGIPILDGSRGDCAWGADPDAVQPGLLGPSALPALGRDDYVANANNSPWLTNPRAPLAGYPRVVGDTGTARSARTQEAITATERRLSGTDTLPGRGFSLRTMQRTLFGDHSRVAELIAADTVRMCREFPDGRAPSAGGSVDMADGCAALARWDGTYGVDSEGSLLFARFVARLGAVPGGPWRVPFDPADPVDTPRGLDYERPEVQKAFGDAAAELRTAGIPLDGPLGDHQYVTRGGARIPVPGAPHALGVLNVVTPVWDPKAGNTEVVHGSSFIQVVEFPGGRGPRAATLLTYGQSSDPTSPHHADQTRLFSAGRWVRDRFTDAEIAASPALRTLVLDGGR